MWEGWGLPLAHSRLFPSSVLAMLLMQQNWDETVCLIEDKMIKKIQWEIKNVCHLCVCVGVFRCTRKISPITITYHCVSMCLAWCGHHQLPGNHLDDGVLRFLITTDGSLATFANHRFLAWWIIGAMFSWIPRAAWH
jgi:hypothetical protein